MPHVRRAPRRRSGLLRPCCWLPWAPGAPASGSVLPFVQVRTGPANEALETGLMRPAMTATSLKGTIQIG